MRIEINRNQLRAALLTAAVKDVRYYLKGVYVEATLDMTRLTATNGHCASVQRHKAVNDCTESLIIPYDVLKAIKVNKSFETLILRGSEDKWEIVDGDTSIQFKPVEGQFPDYRRMIPTSVSNEPGQFDTGLLALFSKAAKILGSESGNLFVGHNDKDIATVCIGKPDAYIGVIMPFNVNDKTFPSTLNITDHWSKS